MGTPEHDSPHHMLTQALEAGVTNRDWFLWLDVSGDDPRPDYTSLIDQTEAWLEGQDPDAPDPAAELVWHRGGLHVQIRALPKKSRARGANPLVGNPYPAFAYWVTN